MGGFLCPKCGEVRHIAEVDSGEHIKATGELPTVDCCWYCGTSVPAEATKGEEDDPPFAPFPGDES